MKRLLLISLLLAGRLLAQPVITTQPTDQIVLNGSNVTFSVAVSGTGPFTYQWQFNGTNLPNDLTTIEAGNGISGYSGDGGLGTKASLYLPLGVAVDSVGNLYIAENYNSVIRKLDSSGIITTIAGKGIAGFSGDGGEATNANLSNPAGIAVDSFGNIYIADSSNNRVRRIDVNGIISTAAGNGASGFSGDGGLATDASLLNPTGVVIDNSGNLYIADTLRVRKVDIYGRITTVAGNGNYIFSGDGGAATNAGIRPYGVALDNAGNLYIADPINSRIRKVDTNGVIMTIAGNGTLTYSGDGGFATNASLDGPCGVAVDNTGNCFIADSSHYAIRKVDTNGIITTVAGRGYRQDGNISALSLSLSTPEGVALDTNGNLFISDTWDDCVREVARSGPRLKLNDLSTNNAGSYSVIISNSFGSVTSSVVHLTIVFSPSITTQPLGQEVVVGTNVVFSVAAEGTDPLTYQWQFNGTNLDGATNTSYAINSATPDLAGNYSVIITNLYGCITSSAAVLTTVPLSITAQLQSQQLLAGSNVTFSVSAISTQPLAYQWFFNGNSITNASDFSYSINPVTTDSSGNYSVVITNIYGSAGSTSAVLTVVTMDITNQPRSQSILSGSNVTFSVAGNILFPVAYQWQFNGTNIPNATNASYSIAPVTPANAGNYTVVLTNLYGASTSSVAVLTVLVFPPSIITQPLPQEVHPGGNATFSVTASGTAPLSYQWLFGGVAMLDQTNSILSLSNVSLDQAGAYNVVITNSYGSITSRVAVLVVGYPPVITSQPTNQSVLAGNRALIVAGVDGDGPLTFQWQFNGTNLPNNLITTIAGNGINGFAGDGGLATTGKLYYPYGVAADNAGNVFIVDSSNYRIRKVDLNGVMTTVVGKGVAFFSGDGGAATNAYINTSYGMAVDGMGNLFIADTYNNRIRKVDTNGIITTVAGKSSSGFSGDGGAATNARLSYPYGVALDTNGNLYIADASNYRIRKVDTNGIITTVAGNGSAGFSGDGGAATNANLRSPRSVAVDAAGNLFIVDSGNYRIRKVDFYGTITTIGGNGSSVYSGDGGMATNAGMYPYGVSVDNYGDVFIANYSYSSRIRRVDPYGIITTVAGTNGYGFNGDGLIATNAMLCYPGGVAVDSFGRTLIADTSNNRIRRFGQGPTLVIDNLANTSAGNYTLIINSSFGSVTSSVATLTVLGPPFIVSSPTNQTAGLGSNAVFAVNAIGVGPLNYQWQMNGTNLPDQTGQSLSLTNVQWSDTGNYAVIITNNYGSVTSSVATLTVGWPPAITSQPTDLMVSAGSNVWFSVQVSGDSPFTYQWQLNGTNLPPIITTFAGTNAWGYSGDGGIATNAKLSSPRGVCVDKRGNVYIAENGNSRVRRVDTNGIITTFAGTGTSSRSGDGGQATNANLLDVSAVSADVTDNIFIVGSYDIRKVNSNGIITPVAGYGSSMVDGVVATNAYIGGATCVTIDHQENIFYAESGYHRIRKIGTNGIVTTIGGNPNGSTIGGFSGDGGPATNAALGGVNGITVDGSGNVYFSDTGNGRIRKVDANGIINTVAGGGGMGTADGIAATNLYLNSPLGVCANGNNLFFGANSRVLKMDNNGIVTMVAGGRAYSPANNGDYGAATNAYLGGAYGIAFDVLGNMLIADGSWRVRKVHFSGDPTLYLPNSGTNNTGVYTVVITSPYGSVTSSNFTLTVINPPSVVSVSPNPDGSLTLNLTGMTNFSSRLYATTNLSPPIIWTPISTNPAGGAWQFTDTNTPGQPVQFYRVSTP